MKNKTIFERIRAQELCESRGGRPVLPVSNTVIPLTVSADVKQLCF